MLINNGKNMKLGNMGSISKLMGNEDYYIPQLNMCVKGTCGKYCEGCKGNCYVEKSYRGWHGKKVKYGHATTTLAMRNDLRGTFEEMDKIIKRKRIPYTCIRINQSGEFESAEEVKGYIFLAKQNPSVKFYVYTKNFDAIREVLTSNTIPKNLFINISVWGKQGISEYKEFSEKSNQIRAFVYVDNTYNVDWYAENGLEVKQFCGAYDRKGKMNHVVTCDKCKMCYSRRCKALGCYAH